MNTQQFIDAYRASRNGTDAFHRNPLYPKFVYSDGVKECAEAGCYWLLDILGTELPGEFKARPDEYSCLVKVNVAGGSATIKGEFCDDDDPTPYTKGIEMTDMPDGEWKFYVTFDDAQFFCILLSEY